MIYITDNLYEKDAQDLCDKAAKERTAKLPFLPLRLCKLKLERRNPMNIRKPAEYSVPFFELDKVMVVQFPQMEL